MLSTLLTLAGIGSAALFIVSRRPGLVKGWEQSSGTQSFTLIASDNVQIITVFLSILLKYVPGTSGYGTRLKPNSKKEGGFSLPPMTLEGPINIVEKDIETFNNAVESTHQSSNSSTDSSTVNPFLLVSFTTPLLLFILSNHACPIRPIGAVNTQNKFEFEDAAFCRNSKAILSASQSGSLTYTCDFGGSQRLGKRHKRGVEFEITIEVRNQGQVVLRQHLQFLQFLSKSHPPQYVEEEGAGATSKAEALGSAKKVEGSQPSESSLHIGSKDPLRWAASCTDYNPIHVSGIAAKVFGFKSVIAHGNHGVALAIQELLADSKGDSSTPKGKAANACWTRDSAFDLEVKFVKPMLLPAELTVRWSENDKGMGLEIDGKGQSCVIGQLGFKDM